MPPGRFQPATDPGSARGQLGVSSRTDPEARRIRNDTAIAPPPNPCTSWRARPRSTRHHGRTLHAINRSVPTVIALPTEFAEPADRLVMKGVLGEPGTGRQHRVPIRQPTAVRQELRRLVVPLWESRPTTVAVGARKTQILELVLSTTRNGNHVIDRASTVTVAEVVPAIPTAITIALEQTRHRSCPPRAAAISPRHHGILAPDCDSAQREQPRRPAREGGSICTGAHEFHQQASAGRVGGRLPPRIAFTPRELPAREVAFAASTRCEGNKRDA
jgi:hypothetical protein